MRPQIVKIFAFLLCLFASIPLSAAPVQAKGGPPEPTLQRTPGPELPIDTNLFVLVAIALILGVYVAYKRHKVATQDAG